MTYYDHHYISNSDLKKLRKIIDPKFQDPADLEEIFKFGTLFHALVLEPHKADYSHPDLERAIRMKDKFFKDPLCRKIMMVSDIRREHEFYRVNKFGGVSVRCKVDFLSKGLGLCGELKGLSCNTEKAFEEAVDRFDYDQAVAWYLDTSELPRYFMGAPSKDSDDIFKRLVDRNHKYYHRGLQKVHKSIKLYNEMFNQAA